MKSAQQIVEHETVPTHVPMLSCDKSWRVRVFFLSKDGKWAPRGTGQCQILHKNDGYYFHVKAEDTNEELVDSLIEDQKNYSRQDDSIISWSKEQGDSEIALSFREEKGAQEAWHLQQMILGKEDPRAGEENEPLDKPVPENLARIYDQITSSTFLISKKARIVQHCLKADAKYVSDLCKTFREAEDARKENDVGLMAKICKGIIGLNNPRIIELLFSDAYFMSTFGMLEYDHENPKTPAYKFRQFLSQNSRFSNTVEIQDPEIIRKIHLTYRLLFFKDSVAARWIDESTMAVLINIINQNYTEILDYVFTMKSGAEQIMGKLRSEKERTNAIKFVLEICNVAKNVPSETKSQFFIELVAGGLLESLTDVLKLDTSSEPEEMKGEDTQKVPQFFQDPGYSAGRTELLQVWSAEILTNVLQILPLKIKSVLLSETEGHRFLSALFGILFTSRLDGPKLEVAEFMKTLLDPDSAPLKNDFFDAFYETHIVELTNFLAAGSGGNESEGRSLSLFLTLDILTYCARLHAYRIRHYVSHNNILQNLAPLYRHRAKHIRLGMLRFFRALVGNKDESLNKYIVTHHLFENVVALLKSTGRDGLMLSALMELFDFVQRENMRTLVIHLMETHKDVFTEGKFAKLGPFRNLRIKYEQFTAPSAAEEASKAGDESLSQEPAGTTRRLSAAEEDDHYFSERTNKEEKGEEEVIVSRSDLERIREEVRRQRARSENDAAAKEAKKRVFPEEAEGKGRAFDDFPLMPKALELDNSDEMSGNKKKKTEIEFVISTKLA